MSALGLFLGVVSALRVAGPLSPRNASYEIEASLSPDSHEVKGRERLTWRNVTKGSPSELVFHLYMNAFRNEDSTFMTESRGRHRDMKMAAHGWGEITVTRVRVDGVDLTARFHEEETLGRLSLLHPVAPGQRLVIELEFTTLLPKLFARTGYHRDFFAVAQWFPKIAVYDCDGGCRFRAHQHHLLSEFFADYGNYDVAIDLPAEYRVGATGVLVDEKQSGPRKRMRYHAEDVHDFVFTASPHLLEKTELIHDPFGELRLRVLYDPHFSAHADRHLWAAKKGLLELEEQLGLYPYSELTVVIPPPGAQGAGGMEYPTLVFSFDGPAPASVHLPEYVTLHELAHQYFYGIVGSDEVEEPWLDEGLAETATDWCMRRLYGEEGNLYRLFGHHLSSIDVLRLGGHRAVFDPIAQPAFDFVDPSSYSAIVYGKTALLLRSFESSFGKVRFHAGMRHYVDAWRFRHPRKRDFIRAFSDGADVDVSSFLERALDRPESVDYQIASIATRELRRPAGRFPTDGGVKEEEGKPVVPPRFTSEVVVQRLGELPLPVEVHLRFEDGSEQWERWDGGPRPTDPRWSRITTESKTRLVSAELAVAPLDQNRLNDSLSVEPDPRPRRRLLSACAQLLSSLIQWLAP
jgi:hypothetical protein